MRRKLIIFLCLVLTLVPVACGGGGDDETETSAAETEPTDTSSAETPDTQESQEPISTCVLEVNADCSGANFAGQDLASVIAPGVNLS